MTANLTRTQYDPARSNPREMKLDYKALAAGLITAAVLAYTAHARAADDGYRQRPMKPRGCACECAAIATSTPKIMPAPKLRPTAVHGFACTRRSA